MKRSTKIIISVLVVLAIVLAPVMFFFGNPLSWLLISLRGNAYLAETYPDLDVQISDISYDPRLGWSAMASSPTSRDTWFTVYIDGWGNVKGDGYNLVLSGSKTADRLAQDYFELAEAVLVSFELPVDASISSAELTFMGGREYYAAPGPDGEMVNYSMEKDYGLDISTLELDADYDIPALGAKHGRVTIYIHDEEVTVEKAAEVLLELKAYFDEAGLPFRGIHLNLREPRNEMGQMVGEQLSLYDFLYEDIYEEGLIERVQAGWDEVQVHYARRDGTLKEEPIPETADPWQELVSSQAFSDWAVLPWPVPTSAEGLALLTESCPGVGELPPADGIPLVKTLLDSDRIEDHALGLSLARLLYTLDPSTEQALRSLETAYDQISTQQLITDIANSPYLEFFTSGSSPYPLSEEGVQYFSVLCPQMAVLMERENWLEELSASAPAHIEALHQAGKGTHAVSLEALAAYLLTGS